jgi:CubicO group peptidase (beta-lactamase class C family)
MSGRGTAFALRVNSRDERHAASEVTMPAATPPVKGYVSPGFEGVWEAFAENLTRRHELGGACSAYVHGEKVVDVWGGIRNKQDGEPWERGTMVIVHSATKGLAAMTLALAHSRGWLDYEELVCAYWPEFAQQGKERITVRQLLAHQAGLFALDQPVDRRVVADLDRLAVVLARQKPAWEPGTRQGYHAITLGYYESELLRRVDPQHRSLGRFFEDEIASPLGLDVYIRLPDDIPNSRLATIAAPGLIDIVRGFPFRFTLEAMNPHSKIVRALRGSELPHDESHIYARNFEVPSGGAVGTARAIARAYSVFATGGHEIGLRPKTLALLAAPAVPPARGFYDECLKGEVQFSLGFMKPSPVWPFGSASSFGSPGSGGSLGFADPAAGIGYAYVTSQMGTSLTGDPRDVALRDALYAALRSQRLPARWAS